MKKFLKEYAPESEELQFFENLEKSKIQPNKNFEEKKNESKIQEKDESQI
jgi:hypothetical protein